MNKLLFMGILGLFALGSCTSKSAHSHDAHNHETHSHEGHDHAGHNHDGHNHATEGHDHEAEVHHHDGHNHAAESHDHAGHSHSHADNAHGHGQSDRISLCKHKAAAAGIKVSEVTPAPFRQVIKTSGEVLAAQGDESVAVATVAGVVSFRKKVTEGMSVAQGSPLVTVSSNNIAEGDPVQRARNTYEVAKKEYERMKGLVGNKIVSEKEFARAEENYHNARISYEALAKNHSAQGQSIPSPISGYVKSILVKEGDYVTVGQPLVSVTQNRRLFLRAEVSEKYYSALRTIRSANFETPYNNKVYELDALNGRLLSAGKASGDNSYYVPVTFEFDNKGDMIPGSYVEVYLLSSSQENVLSLPRTALTEEQGVYFVYLQLDEEGYKKQEVTIGADNGKEVQILKGIHAGDRVVTEGAYQVRLASATNAIPAHSHEH